MMTLLKKIRNFLRNPYSIAKKLPFLKMEPTTILLDSTRFDFRGGARNFKGKIELGANSMLGGEFIFESNQGEVLIGNNTFVNSGTKFVSRSRITLGNDVTVAWGCWFYDHNSHSLDHQDRKQDIKQQIQDYRNGQSFIANKDWSKVKTKEIKVQDKAWIGFDSVILSGVTIGEGAIVGARSVVREDVEPWTIVAGNPAKLMKRLDAKQSL